MESGPETSSVIGDVIHDVALAAGEVVEVFAASASVQEGPLTTLFHSRRSRCAIDRWAERVAVVETTSETRRIIRSHPPTLRAVPADGAERAFGTSAG